MEIHMRSDQLKLRYADYEVLHAVTMEVKKGEILALIGPSGCGKSSLLRCFNRMNDRVKGATVEGGIYLGEKDIYSELDVYELRRRVGMVFQKPNPFPISIYDNVAYGARLHAKLKKAELDELVESSLVAVGLWDDLKDKLTKSGLALSGGQAQRLCIARALTTMPEVLLMDEPTSALDPIATAQIEELIQELAQTKTIVIVTHNMQQAARISDRSAFMYKGELVELQPTPELFSMPKDKRTEDYLTGRFG